MAYSANLPNYSAKRETFKASFSSALSQLYPTLFCALLLLSVNFSCQKNQLLVKESEAFREALKSPFLKSQSLPILKNEFFKDFTPEEIRTYQDLGINIWGKEDLFMRGLANFISIYDVTLKDNDLLVINFRYYDDHQMGLESSIRYQIP
ncbi:MAG: hypothetical protein KDC53_09090 [Saprospiraceae bacterium]|nr:hypothetical protein [Saprospiraceae bacterium]